MSEVSIGNNRTAATPDVEIRYHTGVIPRGLSFGRGRSTIPDHEQEQYPKLCLEKAEQSHLIYDKQTVIVVVYSIHRFSFVRLLQPKKYTIYKPQAQLKTSVSLNLISHLL